MIADLLATVLGLKTPEELEAALKEEAESDQDEQEIAVTEEMEEQETTAIEPQPPTLPNAAIDLLYCIFLIACLWEDLIRAYPGLEADLRARLSELWAMVEMLKTQWTGTGFAEAVESEATSEVS